MSPPIALIRPIAAATRSSPIAVDSPKPPTAAAILPAVAATCSADGTADAAAAPSPAAVGSLSGAGVLVMVDPLRWWLRREWLLRRVVRPGGQLLLVNHFAAERGPRWWVERALAPASRKLGWHPDFSRDALLPPTQARRARRALPGARHVWLKGLGHVPMGDDPAVVHVGDPLAEVEDAVVVGDDDHGAVGLDGGLAEQLHHAQPGLVVERGGRLIADQEAGLVDQGPGVPVHAREWIFRPFASLEVGGRRSTGLGLAIAREMITAHGGELSLADTPGPGATFTFWIPLEDPASPGGRLAS